MLFRTILCMTTLLLSAPALAKIQKISTLAHYNAAFKSDTPMITMYSSVSCGPCKMMKPSFHKMAKLHPDISFYLIDVDNTEFTALLDELDIRSIPHVSFSNKGQKIFSQTGSMGTKELEKWIAKFRSELEKPAPTDKQETKKSGAKKTAKKEPQAKAPAKPQTKKKQKTS